MGAGLQTCAKVTVQAGRSRFTLASLSANDFPSVAEVEATERVSVPESALKELIERTAFAMAQQAVRYYLHGLLRSEEHTSEFHSLMRISYAVFCLDKQQQL